MRLATEGSEQSAVESRPTWRLATVFVLVAIVALPARAHAQEPTPPPPVPADDAPPSVRPPDEAPPARDPSYLQLPAGERHLSLQVSAGADLRDLFGVPIYAGQASVSVGSASNATAYYFTAGAMRGATEYGLATTMVKAGALLEFRDLADHFTFGLELRPSFVNIQRVTATGSLWSLGFGIAPVIAFDVATWEDQAVFIAGAFDVDMYGTAPVAVMFGGTFSLGFRLR